MNDCITKITHSYPIDINLESVQQSGLSHKNIEGKDYFIMNDPEYIRHVLKNPDNYPKKGVYTDVLAEYFGKGVAVNEGKLWERQRHSMMSGFTKSKLDAFISKMSKVTLDYVNDLENRIKENDVIDIYEFLMSLTASILVETLFSVTPTKEQVEALLHAEESVGKLAGQVAIMKNSPEGLKGYFADQEEKYRKTFDDFAYGIIEERRKNGVKKDDVLQLLLGSQEQNEEITDLELRHEIVSLFIGGHDTCGNNLTWVFYMLTQNREIEETIRAEVNEFKKGTPFESDDMQQLKYVSQVFREGLRLFPPVYFFHRQCVNGDKIGDHEIPENSIMSISPWAMHRNPNFWEDPFNFNPDRFKEGNPPNPAFIPFGWGPHVCIGQGFALRESPLVLAALVQNFSFELIEDQNIEAYGGVLLRPRYGLKMRVKKI